MLGAARRRDRHRPRARGRRLTLSDRSSPRAAARRVERRARALRQLAAHPPPRAREAEVRDLGEAELVLAQRQQQVGDAVAAPAAHRRLGDPHAPAVDPPAAASRTRSAPCSPTSQTPSVAALERQAGRAQQLALGVADQVAEQPERDALGAAIGAAAPARRAALAAERHHRRAPAARLEPGDRPRVREADRARPGRSAARARAAARPGAMNTTTIHAVHAVQRRPSRRSVRSLASSRQRSRAASARPPRRRQRAGSARHASLSRRRSGGAAPPARRRAAARGRPRRCRRA